MKTKIVIQPAIKTMGISLKLNRQDITSLSFWLQPDIFLNDCYIDGKSYEINFNSTLQNKQRHYKLPVFLSTFELHYDLQLQPNAQGVIALTDQDGWLPVWLEADTIREFDIRYPEDELLISNYSPKAKRLQDGFAQVHLIGQGPFELVLGRLRRVMHYGHSYYLHSPTDVELFDKFMRETKAEAEKDWGKPDHWPGKFVELERELSQGMISVSQPELKEFKRMPEVLKRLLMAAYPVKFGEYFKPFHEPFYRYLAWRSLRGVMSESEQAKLISTARTGHGPLVESDPSQEGVAFFKALEDCVTTPVFQERVRQLMIQFRDTPMSLVHFINLFGQEEATRQLLEEWLFVGH